MKMFRTNKKKNYGMKENKASVTARTRDEIKTEYLTLATELGSKKYQVKILEHEMNELISRMSFVNQEAHNLEQQDSKAVTNV